MGCPQPINPRTNSQERPPRSPMERPPCRSQRNPLGVAYGSAVGRTSRSLSLIQTCHQRFQQWVRSGILKGVLETLAEELHERGHLDVREAFIDGSFAPAKKGPYRISHNRVTISQNIVTQ